LKNPDDFFIQPEAMYTQVLDITEAVTAEFNASTCAPSEIFEGDFCWAKYPVDLEWYRAHVS
jgi:Tudor domain